MAKRPTAAQRFNQSPSQRYRDTVAMIARLAIQEGINVAVRAYAQAVAELIEKRWIGDENLKPAPRHICLRRLIGLTCNYKKSRHNSARQPLPQQLPGQDHASLWLKDGHASVFVSQPYGLGWEGLEELVLFCRRYGLRADIDIRSSWHFPGRTLLVAVRPQRKDPASPEGRQNGIPL